MPKGTAEILESRSLQNSYASLIPLLKKGWRVLDVGCGTGAIAAGIAERVGAQGYILGIDRSDHLISTGKKNYSAVKNLELREADLFKFSPDKKFDLVISARVLQWLSNPQEALVKFKDFLIPGGIVSILDYNHSCLEWQPSPPLSILRFYQSFLNWRSDAGMDNEIADHLQDYFARAGFQNVEKNNAKELYQKGEENFLDKIGIWSTVAATRGLQMVQGGYITEEERIQTISEYNTWMKEKAEHMIMHLHEVRGEMHQ